MSDDFDFSSYIQLVHFLGACLDDNTEIVLNSFDDISNSIIAIHNGHISGRKVGAPLTSFALSKLKDKGKEGPPYYLNYLGMSKDGITLRSNSFFILDKEGNPRGMLCINTDIRKYKQAADLLQKLAQLPSLEAPDKSTVNNNLEIFQSSPTDMINGIIDNVTHASGIPVKRLTVDEKLEIVKGLNNENFFLIKGAVNQLAKVLQVSEATVYRYISIINNN